LVLNRIHFINFNLLPHSVPKGCLGLVQGLPLGRKLSQFFGRVILIMTTALCAKGQGLPLGKKLSQFFGWPEKTKVFFRKIKKSQTSPDKVGYFNYGPEKLLIFFVADRKALGTSPKGPGKLHFSLGKFFQGN
jgi:hypothetical protein